MGVAAAIQAGAPSRTGTRLRVLIADDDPDMRDLIGDILRLSGYESIPAANGLDAVELAKSALPDAITLDLTMPRMDGNGVLRQLASNPRTSHIPVVIISSDVGALQKTSQVVGTLEKPFDLSRFLTTIGKACRRASKVD